MLCTTLSPMRPRNAQRQSDREDHLYGTKGTWINCPTCFPVLNVGFMTSLRRTDCFILIWTGNAALAVSRHCHFSKLSRLQIETDKKQERISFRSIWFLLHRKQGVVWFFVRRGRSGSLLAYDTNTLTRHAIGNLSCVFGSFYSHKDA